MHRRHRGDFSCSFMHCRFSCLPPVQQPDGGCAPASWLPFCSWLLSVLSFPSYLVLHLQRLVGLRLVSSVAHRSSVLQLGERLALRSSRSYFSRVISCSLPESFACPTSNPRGDQQAHCRRDCSWWCIPQEAHSLKPSRSELTPNYLPPRGERRMWEDGRGRQRETQALPRTVPSRGN
jgi:hypothetical protein